MPVSNHTSVQVADIAAGGRFAQPGDEGVYGAGEGGSGQGEGEAHGSAPVLAVGFADGFGMIVEVFENLRHR